MTGSSKPWPDILEAMTGDRKMTAQPLLEYFKPLHDWLDDKIAADNITIGWSTDIDDFFPETTTTSTTPATTSSDSTPATTSSDGTPATTSSGLILTPNFIGIYLFILAFVQLKF